MINEEKLLQRLKLSYLLRGGLNVLFGILALSLPNLTAVLLIYIFAFNSLLISGAAVRIGFWAREHKIPSLLFFIEFLGSFLVGFVGLFFAKDIVLLIVYILGFWSVGLGIVKIISALLHRGNLTGVIWLSLAGWIYFFIGAYLLGNPEKSLPAAMFLVGIGSIFSGISLIMLSFRLKLVVLAFKKNEETDKLDK